MAKMSKLAKARQERAISCGDRHFEGDECVKCGETKRYAKTTKCVNCRHLNHKAKWMKAMDKKQLPPLEAVTIHKNNPMYQRW